MKSHKYTILIDLFRYDLVIINDNRFNKLTTMYIYNILRHFSVINVGQLSLFDFF